MAINMELIFVRENILFFANCEIVPVFFLDQHIYLQS